MAGITRERLRATGRLISLSDSTDAHQDLLWQPEEVHSGLFAPDFQLRLKLVSIPGVTIVAPCVDEYPLDHFRGGIGILQACDAMPRFKNFNHSGYFTLLQRGLNSHEFLDRRFKSAGDLRERGHNVRAKSGILPAGLGTTDGQGPGWTISTLLKEGAQLASEMSLAETTPEQIIRLGFLAAARLAPLPIPPADSNSLVRNVFFALPPDAGEVPNDVRTFVRDQLALAMRDRLDTLEQFKSIIADHKANIVRRISKVKGPGSKKVSREVIRRIQLEVEWESFVFCGRCVEMQMRAIEAGLPQMSPDSNRLFRLSYYCQPKFGGIPLALANCRLHFLKEAISAVLSSNGSDNAFAVLYRMLAYYAELIDQRRASDRQYANERGDGGGASTVASLRREQTATAAHDDEPSLREIVKSVLIERKEATERDFNGDWKARCIGQDATSATIEIDCCNPALSGTYQFALTELRAAGSRLRERNDTRCPPDDAGK